MKETLRVIALSRSGCHAVGNWVAACMSKANMKSIVWYHENVCAEDVQGEAKFKVLVLRSPRNFLASRMQHHTNNRGMLPIENYLHLMGIWKHNAQEIINGYDTHPGQFSVLYDCWHKYPGYRRMIAVSMGLPFTDASKEKVIDAGGGSSFNKMEFNGKAHLMGVLDREKHFASNPTFVEVMQDKEIDNLWNKLPHSDVII